MIRRQRRGPRTRRDCPHGGRHQHGTPVAYSEDRCRCDPCTDAKTEYWATMSKLQAYGRWNRNVDSTEARTRLRALEANGIGYRRASEITGLSIHTIRGIRLGRKARIHKATHDAILAVPVGLAPAAGVFTDGTGTRRRIQALLTVGWSLSKISARCGLCKPTLNGALNGHMVTHRTAAKVRAEYERLWNHEPPHATKADRVAASRARNWAAANGWAPPLAWDDDTIDDPAAQPQGVERVSRYGHTADDLAEDVHHLLAAGTTRDEIAARTGRDPRSIERELARHGHHRLAAWLHTGQEPAHDAA